MERLQAEFRSQMDRLKDDYFEQMRKLKDIPNKIPKEQLERDRDRIMSRIEEKMVSLGQEFAARSNAIMEDFIQKVVEQR